MYFAWPYKVCNQWLHPLLASARMLSVYSWLLMAHDYKQYTYFSIMGIFSVTETPWSHAALIRGVLKYHNQFSKHLRMVSSTVMLPGKHVTVVTISEPHAFVVYGKM